MCTAAAGQYAPQPPLALTLLLARPPARSIDHCRRLLHSPPPIVPLFLLLLPRAGKVRKVELLKQYDAAATQADADGRSAHAHHAVREVVRANGDVSRQLQALDQVQYRVGFSNEFWAAIKTISSSAGHRLPFASADDIARVAGAGVRLTCPVMKLPNDAGDESRSVPVEHELHVLSAQTHFDWRTGAIGNNVPSAASFVSSVARGDRVIALPLTTSSVVQAHVLRSGHDDLVQLHQLLHVDTATAVATAAAAGGTPAGPLAAAATAFADFHVCTSLNQARALGALAVFCASKSALNAVQALEDSTDGFGDDDGNGGDGDAPANPAALRSHLRDMRMLLAISARNKKYAALHDIVGDRLRLAVLPPTPAEYVKLLQRDETSIVIPDGYLEGDCCPEILDRAMNPPPVLRAGLAAAAVGRFSASYAVTALFALLVQGDGTDLANDAVAALQLLQSQAGQIHQEVAALVALVDGADTAAGIARTALAAAMQASARVSPAAYVRAMAKSKDTDIKLPTAAAGESSEGGGGGSTVAAAVRAALDASDDALARASNPPPVLRAGLAAAAERFPVSRAVTALFALLVQGDGADLANDAVAALQLLQSQAGRIDQEVAALVALVDGADTAAGIARTALAAAMQTSAALARAMRPITPVNALRLLRRDQNWESLHGGITGVTDEDVNALQSDRLLQVLQHACELRWPTASEFEKETKHRAGIRMAIALVQVACALAGRAGNLVQRAAAAIPVLEAHPSRLHGEAFGLLLGAATAAVGDVPAAATEDEATGARQQWEQGWATRTTAATAAAAAGGSRRSSRRAAAHAPATPTVLVRQGRLAASASSEERAGGGGGGGGGGAAAAAAAASTPGAGSSKRGGGSVTPGTLVRLPKRVALAQK